MCTCVPHPEHPSHLPPHPLPLGHPSAPAPAHCHFKTQLCLFCKQPSPPDLVLGTGRPLGLCFPSRCQDAPAQSSSLGGPQHSCFFLTLNRLDLLIAGKEGWKEERGRNNFTCVHALFRRSLPRGSSPLEKTPVEFSISSGWDLYFAFHRGLHGSHSETLWGILL